MVGGMNVLFSDLKFGYASAEIEAAEEPALLLDGFLDAHDLVHKLLDSREFLVLGAKGSGKSAAGLHLALKAAQRSDMFVTTLLLRELSYERLHSLAEADVEPELRLPRAWSWVLLLALLASLDSDASAIPKSGAVFRSTLQALRQEGLLPPANLDQVFTRSVVKSIGLKVLGTGGALSRDVSRNDIALSPLTEFLRDLVLSTRTDAKHILIIDGLDDVVLAGAAQYRGIAALGVEAARLNNAFRKSGCTFKIVVLCRTDIYERLPGPNQNKLRQDMAIELRWFYEGGLNVLESPLAKLANRRAQMSNPPLRDLFEYYLRPLGSKYTVKYFLDHTRHTPRDFLRILIYLQRAAKGAHNIEASHIRSAIRNYAEEYFLPEIFDELDGFVDRDELRACFEVLREFHRSAFKVTELREFANRSHHPSLKLELLLPALYNANAIGNRRDAVKYDGSISVLRYRSPLSTFVWDDTVFVHNAVAKALGLDPEHPYAVEPRRSPASA